MSINICPYDGKFCAKMESRFDTWQKFVTQNEYILVPVNPDTFSDCPTERVQDRSQNCERYYGSLIAMRNTASEIVQKLYNCNTNEQRQ